MTRWLNTLFAFAAHQRDVDKLARLSDHLLADIGLRRDQLDALRCEPVRLTLAEPRVPAGRGQGKVALRPHLQGCG